MPFFIWAEDSLCLPPKVVSKVPIYTRYKINGLIIKAAVRCYFRSVACLFETAVYECGLHDTEVAMVKNRVYRALGK